MKMVNLNFDYEDTKEVPTSEIDKKFWEYFDATSTEISNYSSADLVPLDQGPVLATYAILLAIGGVCNIAVLVKLAKPRRRKSRVDMLMTHLALADVCVTCGVIPLEIGWKYTNAWLGGNFLCKLLLVLRAFGLYLSSNVLVCISIDRFFAVIYPLRLPEAKRRSRQMLYCAWVGALACSLPQSMVFRVKHHPRVIGFEQCVSFDAFNSYEQEVAYNVFCMCAMYFLPLIVITVCYVCIFCEIRKSSKELGDKYHSGLKPVRLRRSDRSLLERARRRTLRMTVTIVSVFALCWLPYAIMAMWYMVDRESASKVSRRIQDLLFAMAVSNSCMNPLVYGSYTLDIRGALRRFLKKCCSSTTPEVKGQAGSSSNKNANFDTPHITEPKNIRTRLGVRFAETSLTAVPERLEVPRAPRGPA
ncbi:neuropeptide receptor A29 [Bombyx mori]|uniref:ACP receptor n=1 Tax=Bombyx mori TaxID=7091 RepID=B3XXP2_BOMMO|nr:neuropeptide receptor A29 [Bombyx mori]ACT79362.1 ACP receptor [Bombyx mori]BAG68428.1 neuropeptide receptor A29 [Bombyx mori]